MTLSEIIRQKITEEGPMSFHDFMEMALYYPELGYYTSRHVQIGVKGDYYTSGNLTPTFGKMIARQLEEMWRLLGKDDFTIVEYGAGFGTLSHDILDYLRQHNPVLYSHLGYFIIEKSPLMRERQKMHLHEKVRWLDSINAISGFTGCIISNEVLDNFSVHRVVMKQQMMEVYVDYDDGFAELLQPAGKELNDYMTELNILLPKGFCTEINLDAIEWMKNLAASFEKGYILTIDYGYPSTEFYASNHCNGTLLCYRKHTINDNPYEAIGEQDITAHVNFSALRHWGLKFGLQYSGIVSQANFLIALGIGDYLKIPEEDKNLEQNFRQRAFLMHTLLTDMGRKYKVLILQKGMQDFALQGLKFSPIAM